LEHRGVNDSLKTAAWRTLVTAAIIVVIGACFYAEENARGLRAWRDCEREITARGESLNWDDFVPAPVPDDQNFYQAPMMAEWFVRATNGSVSSAFNKSLANAENSNNDITELSASNYLAWCSAFDGEFNQIRDALKRPAARINGDYQRPFQQPIQNFISYRVVSQVLAHRAKCHLLLNQPDQALDDLMLLHRFNRTLVLSGKPGTLVTAMIHVAVTGLYVDAIACGVESHSWREPELAALQKQLDEIDLLPDVGGALRAERAGVCHLLDISSANEFMRATAGSSKQVSDLGWWFVPGGWIYQNKTVIATLEGKVLDSVDFTNNTVSPYKVVAAGHAAEDQLTRRTPWNFIAAMSVPNFTKATETMARNQMWVDQARIACALERHRLANGKYPDTLAVLVPGLVAKIPHDIINGKPMSYARIDEQDFHLYSVGWNEVDDGGITAHTSDGKEDRDFGDWVWHYPTQ
jgi:hypothetical protein